MLQQPYFWTPACIAYISFVVFYTLEYIDLIHIFSLATPAIKLGGPANHFGAELQGNIFLKNRENKLSRL